MSVSHHIGLEIAERTFRFVEMQQQDRHTTILRADVLETAHDYASPLLFDLPFDTGLARDRCRREDRKGAGRRNRGLFQVHQHAGSSCDDPAAAFLQSETSALQFQVRYDERRSCVTAVGRSHITAPRMPCCGPQIVILVEVHDCVILPT